ncbi:uncharacterized protein LOC124719003 [Schistocerca piceifrons]|uniref:uncharacterized protein LOC124719003 n=1 Tax=Schistocerca piceifrons TaxID=274613 RepID=UPI001F5FDD4A|nr:uncharacterized protein LOC124719003 [Schistocerca piceifrons]
MSVKGRCIAPLLSACAETLCRLEVFDCNERTVEEATDMFATLGRVHSLRQLLLHVSDSKVRHLIPAVFENGGLPKLQQLSLSCLIADETTRALVPLCPDLRELELVSCEGHTDALFEQLCRLEKLEKLKINSCKCLGEYAMSHIAKLPALNTLEFRDLKFDKLKPSVDCILEISGLRWLYLFESDCWAIPFDKFPGRLVNLRVLEVDCCEGDQIALDRISAQMPDLTVEGYLWEPFPRQYSQNCFV